MYYVESESPSPWKGHFGRPDLPAVGLNILNLFARGQERCGSGYQSTAETVLPSLQPQRKAVKLWYGVCLCVLSVYIKSDSPPVAPSNAASVAYISALLRSRAARLDDGRLKNEEVERLDCPIAVLVVADVIVKNCAWTSVLPPLRHQLRHPT